MSEDRKPIEAYVVDVEHIGWNEFDLIDYKDDCGGWCITSEVRELESLLKSKEEEIEYLKNQNKGFQEQYHESGELANGLRDKVKNLSSLLDKAVEVVHKYNIYVNPFTALWRHGGEIRSEREDRLIGHQIDAEKALTEIKEKR